MPSFNYLALEQTTGARRQGVVQASSREAAELGLIEKGLSPLAVEPVKEGTNVEDILARFQDIKPDVLVAFTRQLATMIESGMDPAKSLETLEESEENVKFKAVIGDIIGQIQSGTPIYEAFAEHPTVFDNLFIAMIEAGESSGNLPDALIALADQLEKQAKMRKAIKSALMYPKVVLVIAFLILSGLMMTLVPQFAGLFEEIVSSTYDPSSGEPPPSSDLPVPTQVVLKISETLYPQTDNKDLAWLGEVVVRFMILFAVIFALRRLTRHILRQPGPRMQWDSFKLRAPMKVGPLVQKIIVARFARTFSSLLSSGVQMNTALDIVSRTSGNVLVGETVIKARDQMMAGAKVSEPLGRSGVFPPMVVRMIEVGEDTGRMEEMLDKVADYYEEEVDLQIQGLTSLIEPLMIVFVGAAVGAVIVAIYLPMLSIYDKIGMATPDFLITISQSLLTALPF